MRQGTVAGYESFLNFLSSHGRHKAGIVRVLGALGMAFVLRERQSSLWEFLSDSDVLTKSGALPLSLHRARLEDSDLITSLQRLSDAVNDHAGNQVIEVQSGLRHEPLIRSFTYNSDNSDHMMQIELWGAQPTLVFLTRKWHAPYLLRPLAWLYSLLGFDAFAVDVKFTAIFEPDEITIRHVEEWFLYLLSGLAPDSTPSFPVPQENAPLVSLCFRPQETT